ncbi:hypothetical protein ACSTB0_13685, partial [Faecalibacterium wellingii]|uniref:hypothetical protein n=1 Tax=Faecalibacterium wellingii TaxID=2929491 RepID=UPI003ED9ED33
MHEAPLDHPFVGAVGRAGCLCGGRGSGGSANSAHAAHAVGTAAARASPGSTRAGHVWNPLPGG